MWDDYFGDLLGKGYKREDLELAKAFVEFSSDLLGIDRDNGERMKVGLDRMAELMNGVLPDFHEGKLVGGFDSSDLNGVLEPIPEEVANIFVGLVGSIMLTGADGPMVIALRLKEALDSLMERLP